MFLSNVFLRFFKIIFHLVSSKETYIYILLDLLKGDIIYIVESPQRRHNIYCCISSKETLEVSSDRGDLDEQQKPGKGNLQEGKQTATTKARHTILVYSESHCGTAATKTLSKTFLLLAGSKVFISVCPKAGQGFHQFPAAASNF